MPQFGEAPKKKATLTTKGEEKTETDGSGRMVGMGAIADSGQFMMSNNLSGIKPSGDGASYRMDSSPRLRFQFSSQP